MVVASAFIGATVVIGLGIAAIINYLKDKSPNRKQELIREKNGRKIARRVIYSRYPTSMRWEYDE